MGNNVGLTTKTLPRIIGDTITYNMGTESTTIIIISGMMDVGCLLFDSDGTMGVCTEVVLDRNNTPIYTVRTSSLNTEIDISLALGRNY